MWGGVLCRCVQQIAVEEQGIPGLERHMDDLCTPTLHCIADAAHIGADLAADADVVDAAPGVAARHNFQAPVLSCALIDGDHDGGEIRPQYPLRHVQACRKGVSVGCASMAGGTSLTLENQ